MTFITRLIGFSMLLLFVFLAAALGAQGWLRQQTQRLRTEAIEAKRAQFAAVVRSAQPLNHEHWTARDQDRLGAMCGGKVLIFGEYVPPPPADSGILYFDQLIEESNFAPITARVTFFLSPIGRLLATFQRVTIGLLFFGFALLALGVGFSALTSRSANSTRESGAPSDLAKAEISSLTHLAETSVAQTAALSRERDVRRLAEEDALLKQTLLTQSVEGKVRLGHDLHDDIIQSLYAAGLTIESVRALIPTDPAEADQRLAQCVQNLNATIRGVRAYITGLAPENLRLAGFAQAVNSVGNDLKGSRDVVFDIKIDEEASAHLTPDQSLEALQIAREAISNSLRHGGASLVTVRLHQGDREICLLIQDNGAGFDAANHATGGYGLGNMEARAKRIGGTISIGSRRATGTRVLLTLPFSGSA
ncbi:MAG: integral rane sensor signal transduction histidine kinase [Verrucomicrobia bacterium]|nr:integral rane sensor signal transduction histidine kinase [Verrucomicrobiota bacterium]